MEHMVRDIARQRLLAWTTTSEHRIDGFGYHDLSCISKMECQVLVVQRVSTGWWILGPGPERSGKNARRNPWKS